MNNQKEQLLGALIGLARATDGSEHLINPSATEAIRISLAACEWTSDLQPYLDRVAAEKRKMVPNCFSCANPCGRTADFDLSELLQEAPEIRLWKQKILAALIRLAQFGDISAPEHLYQGLIVIGIEGYPVEDLKAVYNQLF